MRLGRDPTNSASRIDICMGTVVNQAVYGDGAPAAALAALREIRRLEGLLSRFSPRSEISKLNRAAGGKPVRLRPEAIENLAEAVVVSRLSDGAFDVTACPLVRLWSVTAENPALPSDSAIAEARELVDYRSLSVDPASRTACLQKSGMAVDLGGIAKGYAADMAIDVYRSKGIASAMIDLGGNVAVLGNRQDGSPWSVGIQDPDGARGECLGALSIRDLSVVTSGDYERFFESEGRRYHHIIDPRTGYPAESGLRSVTVVAKRSLMADALSTAAFVLGLERGLELLKISHVEGLFVTPDRKVYMTPWLVSNYTPVAGGPTPRVM